MSTETTSKAFVIVLRVKNPNTASSNRIKLRNTYNTDPVDIGTHSLALYFLPEGDFAPEAHCTG